jgi:hypothetical protein
MPRGVHRFRDPAPEGLRELGKKFNLLKGRDFRASVRRIQRHNILVVGSFILGLDVDEPGIGKRIAQAASQYGVDNLNALFLTPLPGTRLWDQMKAEGRILLDRFPEDWKYYTLTSRWPGISACLWMVSLTRCFPAIGLSIPCRACFAGCGATCGDAASR